MTRALSIIDGHGNEVTAGLELQVHGLFAYVALLAPNMRVRL